MKTTIDILNKAPQYLSGFADAKLKEAETLDTVFCSLIPDYNIDRFEAVAIRVFLGKETNITVYAIDKARKPKMNGKTEKLPVKKFKLNLSLSDIVRQFSNINLTIRKENFDLDAIEVINK